MRINTHIGGVSQVIGFILTFTMISIITISAIYTVSVMAQQRNQAAADILARDIANYVVNAIIECGATRQIFPNANYSKTIDIPVTIIGKNYYIEAANSIVYINTTDGHITQKSTIYKQEDFCDGISGRAYGSSGEITIFSTRTNQLYSIK